MTTTPDIDEESEESVPAIEMQQGVRVFVFWRASLPEQKKERLPVSDAAGAGCFCNTVVVMGIKVFILWRVSLP